MTAKDLKNALLQEAVQGKLVPQIASEGNARDLLEEIRKARGERLPLATARKRSFATTSAGTPRNAPMEITEDEIPFDIPESWCWCRLGEIISIETNLVDSSKYLDYIQIAPDDIGKGTGTLITERKTVRQKEIKSINHLFHADMILYSKIRPRLQKVVYVDFEGLCSADMYPLQTKINKLYLKYVLLSEFFDKEIKDFENRVKMPKLNKEQLNSTKFPLPPLAEQKRIVAAIEKFMPLIEEYGKKETVLNELNAQIGTLTKKAILQEAVQGKLVPQIPAEGNAKDLLEQIKAQKAALIKEGKVKKEKPLPEITEDEIPFDIPENWCWCKVGDLFSTMSGLGYKKDVLEEKTNHMIRVLRGGNILDTSYVFKDDDIMISSEYVKPELFLKKNYLITPAVTSLEHIGKMGYVEKDYDDTVVGGFVLMLIPYLSDETISKYCLYLFGTHWFRTMCKEITHKSGQAFYNLSRDKLMQLEIPLPPLSEQKRIVEAIEKMLPACEKLGK